LAVGVALVRALRELGVAGAQVKWPNDIQVAGAKMAGVLIELASDKFARDVLAPSTAVIGVGINVQGGDALAQQLGLPVTDVHTHLSALTTDSAVVQDRNALLLHLVTQLDADLARFEQEGFAAFQAEWQACHAHQGQRVSIQLNQDEAIVGTALGVDVLGALLLETAAGVRAMHSGEVSLRALPQ
jgi:BirA family transcriptional regulator, biotin operon repressor / biotin---[acetyl-CoA-carboxylase] ligase